MSVHIALVGRTKTPVLVGYHHFGGVSALYLLHSPDTEDFGFARTAKQLKADLKRVGFDRVMLREIDAFDMNRIIDVILDISRSETEKPIYINITGGTNLMAASACSAAFMIGARAYYVLDTRKTDVVGRVPVVELPMPTIPFMKSISRIQLKILKLLAASGGHADNTQLRDDLGIAPQKLSYHVKQLLKKGLISTERGTGRTAMHPGKSADSRVLGISLTNAGRLANNMTKP